MSKVLVGNTILTGVIVYDHYTVRWTIGSPTLYISAKGFVNFAHWCISLFFSNCLVFFLYIIIWKILRRISYNKIVYLVGLGDAELVSMSDTPLGHVTGDDDDGDGLLLNTKQSSSEVKGLWNKALRHSILEFWLTILLYVL